MCQLSYRSRIAYLQGIDHINHILPGQRHHLVHIGLLHLAVSVIIQLQQDKKRPSEGQEPNYLVANAVKEVLKEKKSRKIYDCAQLRLGGRAGEI